MSEGQWKKNWRFGEYNWEICRLQQRTPQLSSPNYPLPLFSSRQFWRLFGKNIHPWFNVLSTNSNTSIFVVISLTECDSNSEIFEMLKILINVTDLYPKLDYFYGSVQRLPKLKWLLGYPLMNPVNRDIFGNLPKPKLYSNILPLGRCFVLWYWDFRVPCKKSVVFW